jgi:chemotaxis protein CheZ
MSDPVNEESASRIEGLRAKYGDTIPVELIADAAGDILAAARGELNSDDLKLFNDLHELASYIHEARAEIASLRPDEVGSTLIPSATDELDAIVEATASATNSIMDATEEIEEIADKLDTEHQNAIMDVTTKVYEACTFQDITGQRITKVVTALKKIEEKVEGLVTAFSDEIEAAKREQEAKEAEEAAKGPVKKELNEKEDLLEGPQLAGGDGKNQDDVDALLASFD